LIGKTLQTMIGWLLISSLSKAQGIHADQTSFCLLMAFHLFLLELKNPADQNADIWKAFDQIQTYKEQIPDVFEYNEVLVISDGTEALLGSLSADAERFMALAHY
jgi:type I restriction enzyme R subunit